MLEFYMPKGVSDKVTFKPYDVVQGELIPSTAEELIPANHLVRIVNSTLDELDLAIILKQYKGGGESRYIPLMLLKILVYGYLNNVYSARLLAKSVRENIYFRWIAGCQSPDFRTINTLRNDKLAPVINEIFIEVVRLLHKQGYVQLDTVYIDGTKIEARANRYTFVWRRAVETFDNRLGEKLRIYLADAKTIADDEDLRFGDEDLPEIGKGPVSSETISEMASKINKALEKLSDNEDKPVKKLTKISKVFTNDFHPRKQKYEYHREQFQGRNSYSKTDNDATFMRMKEDHMLNGQLKPVYNIQIVSEAGFVTTYGIYPNPTDTRTLPSVLEKFQQDYDHYPKNLIADKGYSSTENYEVCESKEIEAYIKYPHWELEKKKRSKKYRYRWWNFKYDEEQDVFTCPENSILRYEYSKTRTRYGGRKEHLRVYTCSECRECPAHGKCTRAEFKKMEFNLKRYQLQQKARARLKEDEGRQLYRKCQHRFNGWGNSNASCEWGLLMMVYNLKNIAIAPRQ